MAPPCCAASIRRSRRPTGRRVVGVRRLGKRVVLELEGELFLILHLMIAGRLHWSDAGAPARTRPRAGPLRVLVRNPHAHRGGDPQARRASRRAGRGRRSRSTTRAASRCWRRAAQEFSRAARRREPHAQARAHGSADLLGNRQRLLRRDPAPGQALAGEARGNAHARPSSARLFAAVASTLADWTERLRAETGEPLPGARDRLPRGHGGARALPRALS